MQANHWRVEKSQLKMALIEMQKNTRRMFGETGAHIAGEMGHAVDELKHRGFAVGMDDVVKFASYGAGGVSGAAASASVSVSRISALMVELNDEAINKF